MRYLAVICLLLLLQACAAGQPVHQDVNLATDFKRIERFSIEVGHPLEHGTASLDVLKDIGISPRDVHQAIHSVLSGKNWLYEDDSHQAHIIVTLTYGERKDLSLYRDYVHLGRRGWLWSEDPRAERYRADTLAIDIFDARTGNALWHGYSQLSAYGVEDQRLAFNQALISILDAFPPDISKLRGSVQGSILVQ